MFERLGRIGVAKVALPLTLVAVMAGAAWAQETDEEWVEGDPGVEDGDTGVGSDDPAAWSDGGDGYLYDESGEIIGVIVDDEVILSDGESDCGGCEYQNTGGEVPEVAELDGRGNDMAQRPNPRGRDGGTCSPDGFIPLPFRCDW